MMSIAWDEKRWSMHSAIPGRAAFSSSSDMEPRNCVCSSKTTAAELTKKCCVPAGTVTSDSPGCVSGRNASGVGYEYGVRRREAQRSNFRFQGQLHLNPKRELGNLLG